MAVRLGELLVRRGILTEDQVQRILDAQAQQARPFGEIAERMFGLSPSDIEAAWAEQFTQITRTIDPEEETIEPEALSALSRRQAWQFGLMPLRRDGLDLMIVTTPENLPRAARFVAWKISLPVYFVLCTAPQLERALQRHYPLPGVSMLPRAGAG